MPEIVSCDALSKCNDLVRCSHAHPGRSLNVVSFDRSSMGARSESGGCLGAGSVTSVIADGGTIGKLLRDGAVRDGAVRSK